MSTPEHYREQLRRVVADRPWVLAYSVLAGATTMAATLQELGASRLFAIGAYRGAGEAPDPDRVPTALLTLPPADMMGAIRLSEAALADLPAEVCDRVDTFDPERRARAISELFYVGRPIAGRPVFGARPTAWQALEDKTVIDALWDTIGVERAPSEVVAADGAALRAAARRLDQGDGTVWAIDNTEGFNGGAAGLRWVRRLDTPQGAIDAAEAAEFAAAHAERARVMPFVEGVPCSIHGWVFRQPFETDSGGTSHTVALRPCEMVVLRTSDARFAYAQAATFWDPPAADREALRALARRVGDHLHVTLGYRGVFTIDGVMGVDGFVPTELNPRFGAAIGVMCRALPELPAYLLHLATVEDEDLDYRPADLERLILTAADAHRQGGCSRLSPTVVSESRTGRLLLRTPGATIWKASDLAVVGDEGSRSAGEGADGFSVGTVLVGPHASGSYIRVSFDSDQIDPGPPVAPRAAAALSAVSRDWGLAVGELSAAREVRFSTDLP